ncbi:hypothetical protein LCGC14_0910000 [marine sediment metagenome]|uniref:DNA methylase N-4/N-6 domain-containing protein n=1 Tax=marine sediment metagenome TaxID=412755 RepID=A0A0F9NTX8_9ZZZZ
MPYLGLQSVRHGNSGVCIEDCFRIHFPDTQLVADLTYGNGRFWKWPSNNIQQPPIIALDAVVREGVHIQSDYRRLPLKSKSVDVAVFDPPFIFSPGLRGIIGEDRGFRGGPGPYNASDLQAHTAQAMVQMRQVARHGMILKGQNLVTSQHPNWWTYQVMDMGERLLGIWPEDVLIQVSSAARMIDPRWKNQYHFRRSEAYYIIYKWSDD